MAHGMRRIVLPLLACGMLALTSPALAQGPEYRAPVEKPKAAAPAAAPAPKEATPQEAAPAPKFPNKDTAKNRQDYEMGTGTGTIIMGRDAKTGEDVVLHAPPKKEQPREPDPPIEVKPVVPLLWKK